MSKKTIKKTIAQLANTPLTDEDVFPNEGAKEPLPFPEDEVADCGESAVSHEAPCESQAPADKQLSKGRGSRLLDIATKTRLEKTEAKLPEIISGLEPWEPVLLSPIPSISQYSYWKTRVDKIGREGATVSRAADGIFVVLKN